MVKSGFIFSVICLALICTYVQAQGATQMRIDSTSVVNGHMCYVMNIHFDGELHESDWFFEDNGYVRWYVYITYGMGADTLDEHSYYMVKQFPQVGDQWDSWIGGPADAEVVDNAPITIPLGTFQAYNITYRDPNNQELLHRSYYSLGVGFVASEHQGQYGELTSYNIVGGTGCFPLAVGNEWNSEASKVNENNQNQPYEYSLSPAYPNPFNATTNLNFTLLRPTTINLQVFDINGRLVNIGFDEGKVYPTGVNVIRLDCAGLPSGLYLAQLKGADFIGVKKLVLLK